MEETTARGRFEPSRLDSLDEEGQDGEAAAVAASLEARGGGRRRWRRPGDGGDGLEAAPVGRREARTMPG